VVKQGRVVLTHVGPFFRLGFPLAQACIAEGTHYVDSTGEPAYVRQLIGAFHEEALSKKVLFLPCSGFDSVPSDLGTFLLHQAAQSESDRIQTVKSSVSVAGTLSHGTVESIGVMIDEMRRPKKLEGNRKLGSWVPSGYPIGRPKTVLLPSYDQNLKAYKSYWLMAGINEKVVSRSAYLLNYSERFSYQETAYSKSLFSALLQTSMIVLFAILMFFSFGRKLILRFFATKTPGAGRLRMNFWGQTVKGTELRAQITSDLNPGYQLTGVMLGETALALVLDRDRCGAGGVLTPASGVGQVLVERLNATGKMALELK
jgi:short subunit dehydrogenase-like uncharacterized protein